MLPFLLAASALCLLAAAFLVWPLWRPRLESSTGGDAANVAIYRDQKVEIEADHAHGLLGEQERQDALNELTTRLASDLEPASTTVAAPTSIRRPGLALFFLVALPALAAALYWRLGTPAAVHADALVTKAPSTQEMHELVDGLARRMETTPQDLRGWLLLARALGALERHAESAAAYARASALVPDDAEVVAQWAHAEANAAEGDMAGKPYELALRALSIDAASMPALALAAGYEMASGKLEEARQHLRALLAQLPAQSEDAVRIRALLEEMGRETKPPTKP